MAAVRADAGTLVLGAIHEDPKVLYGDLRPMADYVGGRMSDVGIDRVEVVIVADHRQMVALMRDGRIDWVSETPYSALYLQQAAGAELLVRKWKDGVPSYRSLFVTRWDQDIDSLAQLAGRTVGFQHPGSTTGYFLPALALRDGGLTLASLATPRDPPVPGKVGFVFSGGDLNTATWIHKGIIDAGVISDVDWEAADKMPTGFRRDLKIIHKTDLVPRALEIVRSDLERRVKTRLRDVLLAMHEDPQATDALSAYQNTRRFERLDNDTVVALERIRRAVGEFGVVGGAADAGKAVGQPIAASPTLPRGSAP